MRRYFPSVVAVTVLVGVGVVHGYWTQRWQTSEAIALAAASLENVPMQVGDWKGEEIPENPNEDQGLAGQLYRRYSNGKGDTIAVALVCDRPGPVCIHTPDVCYAASGYQVGTINTLEIKGPGVKNEPRVFQADAVRTDTVKQANLRMFWTWHANGRWQVSDDPRDEFRQHPFKKHRAVFKLYLVREQMTKLPIEQEPCMDFLAQFLPELDRALKDGSE